jgi:MFS superfamily sulfate permease-like transporter
MQSPLNIAEPVPADCGEIGRFALLSLGWFGGVRYFRRVPGGLVAIAAGTLIASGSNFPQSPVGAILNSLTSGSVRRC